MADNTQVNSGSGDFVRDIDRASQGIAAKTQVVQLDVGGKYAEVLVSPWNGVPTTDSTQLSTQSSDAPQFVTITGDPSGDFAGVNILEKLVDDSGDLKMAVRVVNPPGKFDAQGAQMASDAPSLINLVGQINQNINIDTTGYQSIVIQIPLTGFLLGNTSVSNDGINFTSVTGYNLSSGVPVTSVGSNNSTFVFPVTAKWFRVAITSTGSATAYLRNIPAPNPAVIMPQNLTQWNSVALVSAGLAGVVSTAGPTANAVAPTANPNLIAGVDSGTPGALLGVPLTRRILTDNIGRQRLAEESPVSSFQQTPALNINDSGLAEDLDKYQLLAQILLEMRIATHLLFNLPQILNTAMQNLQNAPTAQRAVFDLMDDEPAVLRAEPSAFIQ